ncbi:MAG: hypothetical protein ACOCXC_00880 [Fibrobacterota bacterium]
MKYSIGLILAILFVLSNDIFSKPNVIANKTIVDVLYPSGTAFGGIFPIFRIQGGYPQIISLNMGFIKVKRQTQTNSQFPVFEGPFFSLEPGLNGIYANLGYNWGDGMEGMVDFDRPSLCYGYVWSKLFDIEQSQYLGIGYSKSLIVFNADMKVMRSLSYNNWVFHVNLGIGY